MKLLPKKREWIKGLTTVLFVIVLLLFTAVSAFAEPLNIRGAENTGQDNAIFTENGEVLRETLLKDPAYLAGEAVLLASAAAGCVILVVRGVRKKKKKAELKAKNEAEAVETVVIGMPPRLLDVLEGKRVLLVEDNELNREIEETMLTGAGLETETADDGDIAVKMVRENGTGYYDFILMDIQMPIMDGYAATKKIRKLPEGNAVPIIAVSAFSAEEDKKRSFAAGMDAHISKPVNAKMLFEVMKRSAR